MSCSKEEALCRQRCCGNLPEPKTLKDLIKGLQMIFQQDTVDIECVKEYMGRYKSCPEEWKPFAKFDKDKYTRNLIDTGNGKYNLILLCWNLSQGSTIHSHAGSHCFMKILQGVVQEEQFVMPKGEGSGMVKTDTFTHKLDDVAYIADSMDRVHRVSNPSHVEQAVTLHLYSPPFEDCSVYDEATSHESTGKMVFTTRHNIL